MLSAVSRRFISGLPFEGTDGETKRHEHDWPVGSFVHMSRYPWWSQADSNRRFVRARDASSRLTMAPHRCEQPTRAGEHGTLLTSPLYQKGFVDVNPVERYLYLHSDSVT